VVSDRFQQETIGAMLSEAQRIRISERKEQLMRLGSMMKMAFLPTPHWVKKIEREGKPATATVLSDPKQVIEGIGGYEGKDGWIDFQAEVLSEDGEQFQAKAKCRLSQSFAMEPGMKVNVRFDPDDRERVVLVDDIQTLLNSRLKPQ
jgi:hypothetical protein